MSGSEGAAELQEKLTEDWIQRVKRMLDASAQPLKLNLV
jgi:glycosyltransferase A (GT-A) superfamily protein (DUF2064 family)